MITQILFVLVVLAAVGIIALVLMQQSKGDAGSAFGGGGGSQSMFGSRGSANFLSRATSILVTVFFVGSLMLAFFYSKQNNTDFSVTEESVLNTEETVIETPNDIPELPDAAKTVVDESAQSDVPTVEVPTDSAANPAETSIEVPTEGTSENK